MGGHAGGVLRGSGCSCRFNRIAGLLFIVWLCSFSLRPFFCCTSTHFRRHLLLLRVELRVSDGSLGNLDAHDSLLIRVLLDHDFLFGALGVIGCDIDLLNSNPGSYLNTSGWHHQFNLGSETVSAE